MDSIEIPNGLSFIKSANLSTDTNTKSLGVIVSSIPDIPESLYSNFCYDVLDRSTKISSTIYGCCSLTLNTQWMNFRIPVPDNMVAIGGGVMGAELPAGVMIMASYPSNDLSSWVVSISDHIHSQPHSLVGFVIGLSINGMPRPELLKYIRVNKSKSEPGQHPNTKALLHDGYILLGGGADIECVTDGVKSFITSSYPISSFEWYVAAKDHLVTSIASVTAYVIGIRKEIPNVGMLNNYIVCNKSDTCSRPSASILLPKNIVLSGVGAHIDWVDYGSLIWQIEPIIEDHRQGVIAGAKDYDAESASCITAYAVGIELI